MDVFHRMLSVDEQLPVVCLRCGEEIEEGDHTVVVPFIPRRGLSVTVHKDCADFPYGYGESLIPKEVIWMQRQKDDSNREFLKSMEEYGAPFISSGCPERSRWEIVRDLMLIVSVIAMIATLIHWWATR